MAAPPIFTRLTHNDAFESELAWSPDGKHIAFMSEHGDFDAQRHGRQNLQKLTQNDASTRGPSAQPPCCTACPDDLSPP